MSAAPVLHDFDVAAPAPRQGRGGHLRVVRPDDVPGEIGLADPTPTEVRMRITRRGRLVLTGTVALLVTVAVAAMVGTLAPAGAATAETIVVQPGQTLSGIAASELPGLPLDQAIVDIQLANQLNSLQVQAGQTLAIPGD